MAPSRLGLATEVEEHQQVGLLVAVEQLGLGSGLRPEGLRASDRAALLPGPGRCLELLKSKLDEVLDLLRFDEGRQRAGSEAAERARLLDRRRSCGTRPRRGGSTATGGIPLHVPPRPPGAVDGPEARRRRRL